MDREQDLLTGSVIGDEGVLSIEELARACSAETRWIIELVDVGVLEPQGTEISRWRFRAAGRLPWGLVLSWSPRRSCLLAALMGQA